MMNYTEILPSILANYALEVTHHEHLRTSENVVVKLVAADGRPYALRIRKILGAYQQQLASELVILRDFARDTQAAVPAPLATRDGKLFCLLALDDAPLMCVIFTWVPGRHLPAGELTPAHLAAMARSTGQLHRFAATYQPAEALSRPIYDEQWFFGPTAWNINPAFTGRMAPEATAYLLSVNEAVRAHLRQHPGTADQFGLIHYDLHVGNFLFEAERAHMIDFDECGFGYYLFDLAHLLFEFVDHPRFQEYRRIVVDEYIQARGCACFPDNDLTLFLALQGIAYANWLYRIFQRDGNTGAQDYWIPIIVRRLQAILG